MLVHKKKKCPSKCPECGGDIEGDTHEFGHTTATLTAHCIKCGQKIVEVYEYKHTEFVRWEL